MKNNCNGLIIIISGPSGVGKGTLIGEVNKKLAAKGINTRFSVSATTRGRSEQEIDGVHYHFITVEKFNSMIENGELAEYNKYGENYYGTPMVNLTEAIEAKEPIILDLDLNGKNQVVEKIDGCLTVFVLPPSTDVLEKRIRGRARETDTEESIRFRLSRAVEELVHKDEYKYRIVNDDLETAANELYEIIVSEISR